VPQAIFKVAPRLVPPLASSLDDADVSGRLLACLCLEILLERLKGAFGDDAVRELYPVFIKRLDDSSDEVRRRAVQSYPCYSFPFIYDLSPDKESCPSSLTSHAVDLGVERRQTSSCHLFNRIFESIDMYIIHASIGAQDGVSTSLLFLNVRGS